MPLISLTFPDKRTRVELLALLVLATGLALSAFIGLTSADDAADPLGYAVDNGSVQTVRPEDSKIYVRDLERYNGKVGVLLYEMRVWFAGLWRGKALAYTLFWLTMGLTAALLALARLLPASARHSRPGKERADEDRE